VEKKKDGAEKVVYSHLFPNHTFISIFQFCTTFFFFFVFFIIYFFFIIIIIIFTFNKNNSFSFVNKAVICSFAKICPFY
jgi:hypothetical protein